MIVKRMQMLLAVVSVLMIPLVGPISATAQDAPLSIARLEICTGVENREPVGSADSFAAETGIVYCFLEARDIPAETTVSFVWFHGDMEVARVPVRIGQSSRWRTFSSKQLAGRIGGWRVEIQDGQNAVLGTTSFTVN